MLEHVVALLDMAELMKRHYPQLDLDLLKTGIICHDTGKVHEYCYNGFIDFSDEGRLLGYIAMGFQTVTQLIATQEGFPEELNKRLLHLLLSHQGGQASQGFPLPMTLEAVVLQHVILLDANANAMTRIQQNDALPDSRWTKYIPLLDRFVYVGQKSKENKNQNDQS